MYALSIFICRRTCGKELKQMIDTAGIKATDASVRSSAETALLALEILKNGLEILTEIKQRKIQECEVDSEESEEDSEKYESHEIVLKFPTYLTEKNALRGKMKRIYTEISTLQSSPKKIKASWNT